MRGHYDDQAPRSLFGSTLGVIGVALGLGIVGAFALDLHSHTCDKCGRKWRHLGAFNAGDERAHSCPACGETQWWKTGTSPAQRARVFVAEVTKDVDATHVPFHAIAALPAAAPAAAVPVAPVAALPAAKEPA